MVGSLRKTVFVALLGVLAGCGGGGGVGGGTGMATAKFAMTDAPFPADDGCLGAVLVDIDRVSMRGTSGWVDVPLVGEDGSGVVSLDLLQLRAGLADALADGQVPPDSYGEIRLHVIRSVIQFTDGTPDAEFKIPSGIASGLKIKIEPPLDLSSGETADMLLDMDLSASFHTAGAGGSPTCDDLRHGARVLFHPVIHAHHMDESAAVSGLVLDADGLAVGAVMVSAYPAGTVLDGVVQPSAASFSASAGGTAAEGAYALVLDPGSYDIYASPPGANEPSLVATALVVAAGDRLTLDLNLP